MEHRSTAPSRNGTHAASKSIPTPIAVSGASASEAVASRRAEFERRLEAGDFSWIANAALESLMVPVEDTPVPAQASLVDELMPRFLERFFRLPEGLEYRRPVLDRYVSFSDRARWRGRHRELIVQAHVLEPSIENLPPPHDALLQFYRMAAAEQAVAICEAHQAHLDAHPPERPRYYPGECYECQRRADIYSMFNNALELYGRTSARFPDSFYGWIHALFHRFDEYAFPGRAEFEAEYKSYEKVLLESHPKPAPPVPATLMTYFWHGTPEGQAECKQAYEQYRAWEILRLEVDRRREDARQAHVRLTPQGKAELEASRRRKEEARAREQESLRRAVEAQRQKRELEARRLEVESRRLELEARRLEIELLRLRQQDAARQAIDAELEAQVEQVRRSGRDPALIEAEIERLREEYARRKGVTP